MVVRGSERGLSRWKCHKCCVKWWLQRCLKGKRRKGPNCWNRQFLKQFARANPLQKLGSSSQPPSFLELTLLEARSLKRPIIARADPFQRLGCSSQPSHSLERTLPKNPSLKRTSSPLERTVQNSWVFLSVSRKGILRSGWIDLMS